jgi:hypothetical protein
MSPQNLRLRSLRHPIAFGSALVVLLAASVSGITSYQFVTPIFGLAAAPGRSLMVADAGAGIVELRSGGGELIAELPGATDVAPIGRGQMFATRGGGPGQTTGALFRVSRGNVRQIADLYVFERDVNPHPAAVDSNPFDVEVVGDGVAVVADAGGNDLLVVDDLGAVDWIALFPNELVSTAHAKALLGCPTPAIPQFAFICNLPAMAPAQAVPTSVAIAPDGSYYVGELKGGPAPVGESRIWRIAPGTLHADCATSPACTVVADGFTSIVDLSLAPDGTLYVTELDEASWAAVEIGIGAVGGTVNRCDTTTMPWICTEAASGLPMPIATTVDRSGNAFVAINALVPGAATVIALP